MNSVDADSSQTMTLLLKLGGSVITDKSKTSTLRLDVLDRLCVELAEFMNLMPGARLVLSHGAGSFGHPQALQVDKLKKEGVFGDEFVGAEYVLRKSVRDLSTTVLKSLNKVGIEAELVHPSDFDHPRKWRNKVLDVFGESKVPLFHGDYVQADDGGKVVSTETLMHILLDENSQPLFKVDEIFFITDRDGVMAGKQLLHEIRPSDVELWPNLHSADDKMDITGGMRSKVQAAFSFARFARARIANGLELQRVLDVLLNRDDRYSEILPD